MWGAIWSPVWGAIWSPVWGAIWSPVWGAIWSPVWGAIWRPWGARARGGQQRCESEGVRGAAPLYMERLVGVCPYSCARGALCPYVRARAPRAIAQDRSAGGPRGVVRGRLRGRSVPRESAVRARRERRVYVHMRGHARGERQRRRPPRGHWLCVRAPSRARPPCASHVAVKITHACGHMACVCMSWNVCCISAWMACKWMYVAREEM